MIPNPLMEPLRISITCEYHMDEKITVEELREVYRLALKEEALADDSALHHMINEMVESKVDPWGHQPYEWDFDWYGAKPEEIMDIIRSFAEEEPPVIPEIPGQITLLPQEASG